ncbi:MAG TPA: hypothetical protein VGK59_14480 [Ohtaekwangia sp.]
MKYFVYVIALVLSVIVFSCNEDEKESLEGKLVKTVWMQTKIEVYENNSLVAELEWPEDPTCGDFLRFQGEKKVSYLSECADAGCGHWLIEGKTVEYIIAADRIIPNLCTQENYQELFSAQDEIEINGSDMVATGFGFGMRFLAAQPEYEEWKTKYDNGTLYCKTYFVASNPSISNDVSCCAEFDWQ